MENHSPIDYGKIFYFIIIVLAVAVFIWLNFRDFKGHVTTNSQFINEFVKIDKEEVRMPAVAGLFYPKEKERLDSDVEHYLSKGIEKENVRPQILIVPHAGYIYSAPVAAKAYSQLKNYSNIIKTVILVGPSHKVAFDGVALSGKAYFQTPLGKVAVNQNLVQEFARKPGFKVFDQPHAGEHALEVQLPFLQKTLKQFSIVPMAYGNVDPEVLVEALKPYLELQDTIIIFSADLSHYYNAEIADAIDAQTAEMVENKDASIDTHRSCGATGINAALILAKENHLHSKLLDKTNSGDVMGDKTSVVGYASWMFINDNVDEDKPVLPPLEKESESIKTFAEIYGRELLTIAYNSLKAAVLKGETLSINRGEFPNDLFNKGASFVTLEKSGELRGCIGTLLPHQSIGSDVALNTYRAALEDNRFSPVSPKELKDIKISISLLTNFEEIKYRNEEDLLNQIVPGVDGLIIRDKNRQGVYLPSVWKQLPDKKDFLHELKIKAGMSPSYWNNYIKAYRFRSIEISPGVSDSH